MSYSPNAPLYDNIGRNYDATRRTDPYLTGRLAFHLDLEGQLQYLDIASGTGNYTTALVERGGIWHGVDLSLGMIRSASRKNPRIHYLQGDSSALPFRDLSFDGAVCTMALHHFPELLPVFCEAGRVLRQGKLVIFTGTSEQMKGYWLNEYFPIAMARSTVQMPAMGSITGALREGRFHFRAGRALRSAARLAGSVPLRRQTPARYLPVRPGEARHFHLFHPGRPGRTSSRLRPAATGHRIGQHRRSDGPLQERGRRLHAGGGFQEWLRPAKLSLARQTWLLGKGSRTTRRSPAL